MRAMQAPLAHAWPQISLVHVRPYTMRVIVHSQAAGLTCASRHVVSRTSDRVHVAPFDRRREWLFEQHELDPARVTGFLIDHETRTIVFHDEHDLLRWRDIRGWRDVIACDDDLDALGALIAGHHAAETRVAVDSRHDNVDAHVLRPPPVRFPDYYLIDVSEWIAG